MKTIISTVLLLLVLCCNAQSVTSENGMVKFSSISDYSTFAQDVTSRTNLKNITENLNGVTVVSKLTNQNDYVDIPDFIKTIINADNMFVINNFYAKFDFANERMLVVNKNVANAYTLLSSYNGTSADVMVLNFGTADNGIEYFEGLENGTVTKNNYTDIINDDGSTARCKGIKGDNKDKKRNVWSTLKMEENRRNHCLNVQQGQSGCIGDDIDYQYDYKAVYQDLFLYFRVVAKSKGDVMCSGGDPLIPTETKKRIHMQGTITYTTKCKGSESVSYDETEYTKALTWIPYEGWRKVTSINFQVNCQQRHTWETAYNHNIHLEIID